MRHRLWLVIGAFVGIAIALFYWFHVQKSPPDQKLSAEEDRVYEAVVRDMITSADGHIQIRQLVLDANVLSDLTPGADLKSCKESARKHFSLENSKLLYNSLADKLYRLFHGGYDDTLRADTIQDFLDKSCATGRLSQTFHTDLPRTFITEDTVHFSSWPIEKDGSKSFEQLFVGAGGVILLSPVGFDSTLHEATVSTSFVCGGLCGSGSRYVLRNQRGQWKVVNKWIAWVS